MLGWQKRGINSTIGKKYLPWTPSMVLAAGGVQVIYIAVNVSNTMDENAPSANNLKLREMWVSCSAQRKAKNRNRVMMGGAKRSTENHSSCLPMMLLMNCSGDKIAFLMKMAEYANGLERIKLIWAGVSMPGLDWPD